VWMGLLVCCWMGKSWRREIEGGSSLMVILTNIIRRKGIRRRRRQKN